MNARTSLALQTLGRGLSDVFFPPVCVHCGGLVEGNDFRHLCSECVRQIDFILPPCCETCGHPFLGEWDCGPGCTHCAGLGPVFGKGRAAVLFRGPVRSLLFELKYKLGRYVMRDLEMCLRLSPLLVAHAREAVLVPVPLHSRKLRERGFNQSFLIAKALARVAGRGTVVAEPLRRIEDTPSQTALDRHSRRESPKNAFALALKAELNPRLRYLLVDDVFTTGSTLNACAHALLRAGCLNLDAAVFAHG